MKWNIDYMTSDGDYCHIWVHADTKEDAISEAYREYWDISDIINIKQVKNGN